MEVNFNLNTMMFSLKTASAATIVHELINAVGVKHRTVIAAFNEEQMNNYEKRKTSEKIEKVLKNVEELPLPNRIKDRLSVLVKPMYDDLHQWYNDYVFFSEPILTPFGNVDLLRSSRAVVNDKKWSILYRFMVACEFCHVKEIFEIAEHLDDYDILAINCHATQPFNKYGFPILPKESYLHAVFMPLTKFWLYVLNYYGIAQRGGWSQETYHCGLKIALESNCSDIAIKFFIDCINPDDHKMLYEKAFTCKRFFRFTLSPDILYTVVCKTSQITIRHSFLIRMLQSLLRWPYQPLLLDVARALSKLTSDNTARNLMFAIICKVGDGFNDYDYFDIFTQLTELYKDRYNSERERLVYFALMIEDERWLTFVCDKFTEDEKKDILRKKIENNVCVALLRQNKLHLMETFIRYCGGEDKSWLLKCKFHTPQNDEGSRWTEIERELEDDFHQPVIIKFMDKILKKISESGKVEKDLHLDETALMENLTLDN